MVWIALVRGSPNLEPSVAELFAFIASRVDWLATTLIVGIGPAVLSTMIGVTAHGKTDLLVPACEKVT